MQPPRTAASIAPGSRAEYGTESVTLLACGGSRPLSPSQPLPLPAFVFTSSTHAQSTFTAGAAQTVSPPDRRQSRIRAAVNVHGARRAQNPK